MNRIKLQPGDIVLEDYHSTNYFFDFVLKLQDWFDKGINNHAMIGYEGNICLESNIDGVKFRRIDTIMTKYTILRFKYAYDKDLMKCLIEQYSQDHFQYSYKGLIGASLSTIYWRFTGKKKQFFPDEHKPYCAELVAELWNLCGVNPPVDEDIITPNDLLRWEDFYPVKLGYY